MASNDLKRVGLVFKADGTIDFKKSLKEINNELSSNYQQLKLTQSQYDKNTTTTQKLQDKYDSMSRTIELQKEKVRILNDELKSLENAEEKDEAAIQKKRKALTDAEIKLNNYNRTLNETEEELKASTSLLDKFSNAAEKTSSKLDKIGKGATLLGTGIVAAGTMAVNSMNNVDDGLDIIVQKTGATGDSLDDLNQVFNNIASSVPGEFSDIGSAIGEINTRLDLTGEELENCSEDFLKFSKVNGTDVNTSVQLVTRAMGDAGISADDYKSVLDMLTVAGQKSGISIDSLTTNLAKYGAPMRALGIDTKNAIAMFAGWEKAGVNTEIAFSGMKNAISGWGKEGKDATKEFSKTLEEIKKCPTIAEANSKAIEAFGKKAGPDLADAIQGGRFSFEEYVQALDSSAGAIESTYAGIVDEVDDAQLAHQNMDLALHGLGETISKFVGPILLQLSQWFKNLMDRFDNLDPRIKDIVMKVSGFLILAGPLFLVLSKIVGSIVGFTENIKKLKTAFTGISSIIKSVIGLLNAKIVIIGLIIAAVVLLVVTIVKNWDKIKEVTSKLVSSVGKFFNKIGKFFSDTFVNMQIELAKLKNWFIQIFQNIDDFFSNIFMIDFTEKFGFFGEILNFAMANFQNFYDSIKQILQGIIDFVAGVFTGDWSRAWEGIKNILGGIFNGLLAIVKIPLNGIIGFLNMIIGAINTLIGGINSIGFDVPDWVPGLGGKKFGFNIPRIGTLAYLAKGGDLLQGTAVVAEAGPEMLFQQGNKTRVVPLTNNSKTTANIIDYEKLFKMFLKALNSCKLKLDREGFIKFINNQIWEAMN